MSNKVIYSKEILEKIINNIESNNEQLYISDRLGAIRLTVEDELKREILNYYRNKMGELNYG